MKQQRTRRFMSDYCESMRAKLEAEARRTPLCGCMQAAAALMAPPAAPHGLSKHNAINAHGVVAVWRGTCCSVSGPLASCPEGGWPEGLPASATAHAQSQHSSVALAPPAPRAGAARGGGGGGGRVHPAHPQLGFQRHHARHRLHGQAGGQPACLPACQARRRPRLAAHPGAPRVACTVTCATYTQAHADWHWGYLGAGGRSRTSTECTCTAYAQHVLPASAQSGASVPPQKHIRYIWPGSLRVDGTRGFLAHARCPV